MPKDTLIAFYDLEVSPISFDFAVFLILAEFRRRQIAVRHLQVVVVHGGGDGFRQDDAGYDTQNKRWRLQNIIIPLTSLLEATVALNICSNLNAARNIKEAHTGPVFPDGYTIEEPVSEFFLSSIIAASTNGEQLPSFQAPTQARAYMRHWLNKRTKGLRPVTITLRESSYDKARNSKVKEWLEFAKRLDKKRFCPVIVRDTEKCFETQSGRFEGLIQCDIASVNLLLRMALYEESWLNLIVPNGPSELCRLSNSIRYLYFKVVDDSTATTSKLIVASQGIEIGGQMPFATPFQELVWEQDNLETIERHFNKMVLRIETEGEQIQQRDGFQPRRNPMETAVQLQMTGRPEAAVTIYQEILKKDPKNADAWHFLAIIAQQAGRLETAERMVLKAIELRNNSANFFVTASRIERDLNKFEEALQAIQSAIALNTKDADAHADLAELLLKINEQQKSEVAMMRALKLAPSSVELCERAAKLLQTSGNINESINFYRRAVDLREELRRYAIEQSKHMSEIPQLTLETP